jgi:hypothetical protein
MSSAVCGLVGPAAWLALRPCGLAAATGTGRQPHTLTATSDGNDPTKFTYDVAAWRPCGLAACRARRVVSPAAWLVPLLGLWLVSRRWLWRA